MNFVPHQDRHPLHGTTVVLETDGPMTYVGRLDTADARAVVLKNVGVHDAAGPASREDYVRRALKFGIRQDHEQVVVESSRVRSITPLGQMLTS